MLNGVEYVRNLCRQRKIPVSQLEAACGFANGYLNPKKLKAIPYDRALQIGKYLGISTDDLFDGETEQFFTEKVSRLICDEIKLAYHNSPKKFENFYIPNEVLRKIMDGTYQFSNITFPQFSKRIGKSLDDIIDEGAEKAPSESGEGSIPHEHYREVLAEGGIRLMLDADANVPQEHIDEIVEFIKFKQRKNGR